MKQTYVLLALVCSMLFSSVVFATNDSAKASAESEMSQLAGADFWRQVKSGEPGATTAQGAEAGVLINTSGALWANIRNNWVTPFGLLMVVGAFGALAVFYFWIGSVKLSKPKTGKKILRWTPFERGLHWFTATMFIVLTVSGLIILYGKFFIKPIAGDAIWANMIMGSKLAHNYMGPLFAIGLLTMLIKWFKNNFFTRVDLEWFKQFGGMLPNGKHPSAAFLNGGEKFWFWLLATAGVLVCITGLVLNFPMFGQLRTDMQIANIIHSVVALGLVAASLGHAYIGSIGGEGSIDAMKTGYVDETWAKQHHDLWYEEVKDKQDKK